MNKFNIEPLLPAYGRDYNSKNAMIADFNADKDFFTCCHQLVNRSQLQKLFPEKNQTINIRYSNQSKVLVAKIN